VFRIIGGGLGGYKFWDQNVSASWEMGTESRIPGVKIVVKNASGTVVYQTTTQAAPGDSLHHGLWEWPSAPALLPGEYTIEEVVPANWVRTYPETNGGVYRIRTHADGTFDLLSQKPAHFTGSLDFGNALPMGYKFLDENKNARRDSGEGRLGNWRITLQDMNYKVVYSTQTVAGGSSPYYGWWFLTKYLAEGDYYVFEEGKDGWEQTYPDRYNGAYKIHLYADGRWDLLSGWPSWHDGLTFGNVRTQAAPECPRCPEWVVFQSDREDDDYDIYRMRFDGTGVEKLTEEADEEPDQDVSPTWAFDAARIAFASNRDGDWEIYRMMADGTGETNVTQTALAVDGVSPADDLAPSWGCGWIAFQTNRDGNWEIYKTDADGHTQVRLTEHPASDEAPAWSYDEQWIAFQSDRDGNWELYVMDGEGENVRRLTENASADRNPSWSLDGEWIAFESDRDGQFEIYKMKVETGEVIRLTDDEYEDTDAAWAPYCDYIFWQTNRDLNWEVYRMEEDGSEVRNVSALDEWADELDEVPSVNHAPRALDDSAVTEQGTPVKIEVLGNDVDADGDAISVSGVSEAGNGWCQVNEDGTITYAPKVEFTGTDTFEYTIMDANGATHGAQVMVTVNARPGLARRLWLGIVVRPAQ